MTTFNWSTEDRFLSNEGAGPLRARILSVVGGEVQLERWLTSGGRRKRFSVPVRFWLSDRNGWKLAARSAPKTKASK